MQRTQNNKMGVMPVAKLVINMSLPMMISMLVQALYNVVDSVYVGHYSQQALTAVSLCFPAQNMMIGLGTGTAVGVNALLSRSLGANDRDRANRVAEHGVFLSLLAWGVFLLFGLFGARPFLSAQTGIAEIVDYGVDYLSVVCCFSLGMYMQIIFERLMQSTGRTFYTMITQGTGAVVNIILDPVFIFALDMGVRGAAIATVIGQFVACILAIVLNHKKNPDVQLDLRAFRPEGRTIAGIYAIGLPSVVMMAVGSVMTFLMNRILILYTRGKEVSATVFGVYFKLNSFIFMPVFGLNNGVIPIVAYNYGARNRRRMTKAMTVAIRYAVGLMCVGTVLFEAAPAFLLRLFNASEEMLAIGVPALRIIGVHFPVAGLCIVLGSSFQALGFGTYSLIVSLARQLVVLIPVAWLLAYLGQQTGSDHLVWFCFPIAELASLLVTLLLFARLKRNVIDPVPEGAPAD